MKTLKDAKALVRADDPETPQDESGRLAREIATMGDSLEGIHAEASDLQGKLDVSDMQAQGQRAAAAAASLCTAILTPDQKAQLDAALVELGGTDCAGERPEGATGLVERLDPALDADLQAIVDSSDTTGAAAGAAAALARIEDIRADLDEGVQLALDLKRGDPPRTLEELTDAMEGAFTALNGARGELDLAVEALKAKALQVPDIRGDIDELVTHETAEINGQMKTNLGQVTRARDLADEELGTMFDQSARGLESAADTVVQDGRKTLKQQKFDFFEAQNEASNRISGTIEKGLGQINSGVSASTRDMEAATTLLTADLRKVLLDLGERRVGGGGLLGAMATNAATARSADYQLALATGATSAYANVRGRDIAGIMLRQEQTDAAMRMLAEQSAFQLDLPSGSVHRTVYSFTIGAS